MRMSAVRVGLQDCLTHSCAFAKVIGYLHGAIGRSDRSRRRSPSVNTHLGWRVPRSEQHSERFSEIVKVPLRNTSFTGKC